ncbi:hypothetical protein DOT_5276 [Desulfosporosinus sp. OT]|nr:hypothetical protein DOT_5276 [Desulfosporosinus sp. OT]
MGGLEGQTEGKKGIGLNGESIVTYNTANTQKQQVRAF